METTPDTTTTPVEPPVSEPAPASNTEDSKAQAAFWKSKYDGLQGYVKNLTIENNNLKIQVHDMTTGQEGQISTLTVEKEQLAAENTRLKTETEQLKSTNAFLSREKEIRALIAKDYKELVGDYESGLLRVDGLEGEQLTAYLNNAKTVLSSREATAVTDALKGAAPPIPTGSTASKSEAELYRELMEMDPRDSNYAATKARYDEALAAADKK